MGRSFLWFLALLALIQGAMYAVMSNLAPVTLELGRIF